jgi:low temperature requirement protein LtrA
MMRPRAGGASRVTNMELFFDLVYVFAITQLARYLGEDLNWHGALRTLMLLFAVWWAWVYTAWVTNWLHPDARVVRVVLIGVMLASLIVSVTIPAAFGERGLVFAVTYVIMQLGRTLFAVFATRGDASLRRNFVRIVAWLVVSGAFWLVGGFLEGTSRDLLWLLAVLVDLAGPLSGFYTPGLGRSTTADWTISGDHLAERCQQFVIIALGESVVDTGSGMTSEEFTAPTVTAFVLAFLGTVALWWIYFDRGAEDSSRAITRSNDPGRLGRSAYTYFHLPMVAGIIVTAVGDEKVIAHPLGHTATGTTAVLLAGPALFLAGHLLFKQAVFGVLSWPRLGAIVVLAALVPLGHVVSPLLLDGVCTAVVVVVVAVVDLVRYPRLHGGVEGG